MSEAKNIKIMNAKGEAAKEFVLPESLFKRLIKPALVHQVVVGYAANARAGTAHTKTRDEVSGGGKKPWRQKGTGRARHGSIRSPIWVGGGVVFGPRSSKNFSHRLSKELKSQARSMVVADYFTNHKVTVVEAWPQSQKTKDFASLIKVLKLKRTLVLLTKEEQNLRRALNNLPQIQVMAVKEFNAYDGLRFPGWLVSETAAKELIKFV